MYKKNFNVTESLPLALWQLFF